LREGFDQVEGGMALDGAEVDGEQAAFSIEAIERRDVAFGQIHHVEIVAHAGALGRGVVVDPERVSRQP